MKKETKRIGKWLLGLTVLLCLGLLSGCMVDEYRGEVPPTTGGSGDVEVEFTMLVPGSMYSATKAGLTEEQEKEVKTIELLVFEPGGDGNYRYTVFADMEEATYEDGEIQFKVKLTQGLSDIVVLANSRDLILQSSGVTASNTKSEVLASLIREESSDGKWIDGSYKPIPMFGYMGEVEVKENESLPKVTLIRMLARINVTLSDNANESLQLSEVYLYNPYTKGYVAPDMDKLVKEGEDKYKKVNAPSITGLEKRGNDKPVYYADIPENTKEFTNMIYTFEAEKGVDPEEEGNEEAMLSNTILVLGGYYLGSEEKTYYRIDFHNSKDGLGYLPLLRNHSYEVGIEKVSGPGLANPDEALKSKPMNITASVQGWDDGQMEDVFFDGQYYLTRSSGEFKLSREERVEKTGSSENDWDTSNILELKTDSPFGWKVDSIVWNNGASVKRDSAETIAEEWLNPHIWKGEKDEKAIIQLLVTSNESKAIREGEIHISAGRINCMVKVIQTDQTNLGLSIIDEEGNEVTEIIFPSGRADSYPLDEEQGFTVRWGPSDQKLQIGTTGFGDEPLEFDINSTYFVKDEELSTSGSFTYSFKPTVLGPEYDEKIEKNIFFERGRRADFMVTNGSDYLTKSVYIRQINYGVRVEQEGVYLLDGEKHELTVYANAPWTIKLKEGVEQRVIQGEVNGRGVADTQYGSIIEFQTVDDIGVANPSIFADHATLVVEAVNGEFDPVEVLVYCTTGDLKQPANSYLVKPGDNGILIPASRIHEHDPSFDNYTPYGVKLVWQDSPGVIKHLKVAGNGKDGYIFVQPGDVEGNAVVAATTPDGNTILWSWHIWVADYDPEEEATSLTNVTFMSRNLGALATGSLTSGKNADRYGLLYQWGRKDPFPNSNTEMPTQPSGSSILDERPIYNLAGEEISVGPDIVNTVTTIEEGIQYPWEFGLSWLSSESDYTELWNDKEGKKTIYDPCPYGWRIPADDTFGLGGSIGTGTNGTITGSSGVGMKLTYPQGSEGVFFPFVSTRYHYNGSLRVTSIPAGSGGGTQSNYSFYWMGRIGSATVGSQSYNVPFALRIHAIYVSYPQTTSYVYEINGFNHGSNTYANLHNVADGYVVRCIKYDEE